MGSAEIDAYIANFDLPTRVWLQTVRESLLSLLPKSEEAISYQIIGFKSEGKFLLYISGWKKHCSIHGTSKLLAAEIAEQYPSETKLVGTTLHFKPETLPSDALLNDIVRRRIEIARRG